MVHGDVFLLIWKLCGRLFVSDDQSFHGVWHVRPVISCSHGQKKPKVSHGPSAALTSLLRQALTHILSLKHTLRSWCCCLSYHTVDLVSPFHKANAALLNHTVQIAGFDDDNDNVVDLEASLCCICMTRTYWHFQELDWQQTLKGGFQQRLLKYLHCIHLLLHSAVIKVQTSHGSLSHRT